MSEIPVLEPREAYRLWAESYPPYAHNPLMLVEERAMLAMLPDNLHGCAVLDAGCGSGRYITHARNRGASVILGTDLSAAMLHRARMEAMPNPEAQAHVDSVIALVQASLNTLPIQAGWADVTLCGLTLGHLETLRPPLAELHRVTRPGGIVLCSDFHPIGKALGWQRIFKAEGHRYAVRHTAHTLCDWQIACRAVGFQIEQLREPRLDPDDIPSGAKVDAAALEAPVALVLRLRREGSSQ